MGHAKAAVISDVTARRIPTDASHRNSGEA
jgi:hypothetical protein